MDARLERGASLPELAFRRQHPHEGLPDASAGTERNDAFGAFWAGHGRSPGWGRVFPTLHGTERSQRPVRHAHAAPTEPGRDHA
ncbi:hypothetical protein T492DRAFT_859318 [Pavlovales sp. CCMP2436]|nr:hypothetical protein T492DRAFT_859318 [Pavlovales sp. CCMP2436]